jgi:hypothetical protein
VEGTHTLESDLMDRYVVRGRSRARNARPSRVLESSLEVVFKLHRRIEGKQNNMSICERLINKEVLGSNFFFLENRIVSGFCSKHTQPITRIK